MPHDPKQPARTVFRWFRSGSPALPASTDSLHSPIPILFAFTTVAATLFLASCGSTASQSTQPPLLAYATTNAVYTKGTAITPDTPTNSGGAATSYAITPVLPAGLSLNGTTGVISGTPTAVA